MVKKMASLDFGSNRSMTRDEYYNKIYYPISAGDFREDKKLAEIWENNAPNGKMILDLGCGPGVTLKPVTERNRVFGIDLVDEYLKIAKGNGYYETIKWNAEDGIPYASSFFDIVVCTDLIEHVFNTEFLGKEIYRVLKDEGYAILNVPNHNELKYRLNFLFGKGINIHGTTEDWNYFHIRFFTWKSWNQYLKKLGFRIVEFYPVPTIIQIRVPQVFKRNKLVSAMRPSDTKTPLTKRKVFHLLESLYSLLVFLLPNFHVPRVLANKYPNLFGYRFLVKVVKV